MEDAINILLQWFEEINIISLKEQPQTSSFLRHMAKLHISIKTSAISHPKVRKKSEKFKGKMFLKFLWRNPHKCVYGMLLVWLSSFCILANQNWWLLTRGNVKNER
jgi:hypothetical protein